MVKLSQKSKRITCKRRYRIEKRVRDHQKKMRKENKNSEKKLKKKMKNYTIPNKFPLKEELLNEATKQKQAQLELKKKKKLEKKNGLSESKEDNKNVSLDDLLKQAQNRQDKFNKSLSTFAQSNSFDSLRMENQEKELSLKTFYKELKKVVTAADVIIEVIDARDPMGTRCVEIENMILNSGSKKLVLLLNKIDLVPKENVKSWLKYLSNHYPTVAFKSSTQSQNERLSQSSVPVDLANSNLLKSSKCLGADVLLKLLNNYARVKDIKQTITVGIIGLPNVGKSSVINSLKRSQSCATGSMPGLTRHMQEVKLDKHIKLMDSPGVVMSKNEDSSSLALKNCIKAETLEDPIAPIELLLKRCDHSQLIAKYSIVKFADTTEFLTLIAKRYGKVKKNGIYDLQKAAHMVINDWTSGKINYYTKSPDFKSQTGQVKIVSQLAPTLNIDDLLKEQDDLLADMDDVRLITDGIEVEASAPIKVDFDEFQEDEEEMDSNEKEEEEKFCSDLNESTKSKSKDSESSEELDDVSQLHGTRKLMKMDRKKKMKKERKNQKMLNNLEDMLNNVKIKTKEPK